MVAQAVAEVIDARELLRPWQATTAENLKRFNVLLCARRSGKTVLSCLWLLSKGLEKPGSVVVYVTPVRTQAKRIAAHILQENAPPGTEFNISELVFTLPNGTRIYLLGTDSDNGDSIRGLGITAAVLDEVADISPYSYRSVIRPALADNNGHAIFIGTPKARVGLFYELWEGAKDRADWYRAKVDVYEADSLPDSEIEALKSELSVNEFGAEFLCSWDANLRGAYYAELMTKARDEGRICSVPHDPAVPVVIAMDLGYSDATSVWAAQFMPGGAIHLIWHKEWQNTALPQIVNDIKDYGSTWNISTWILPHDGKVHEIGSGRTRQGIMRELGCNTKIAPNQKVRDGIEAVRSILPKCWFDEGIGDGIEYLRAYRSDYDEKNGVFRLTPVHDFTSHAADALRYLAVTRPELAYAPRDLSNLRRKAARPTSYV